MRKLVWFSIGFAVASFIGAVFYGGWLLLFATLAFVLAGLLTVFTKDWRYCGILRMIMIGCTAGFLWFGIYDSAFVMLPRDADGETITVTMEATDYSYHTGYGSAVDAEVIFQGRTCRVKAYLNGKQAITHYEVVDQKDGKTRVNFYPVTGRTHQLRVHASHSDGLNAPIVGDTLYGTHASRLYLHAQSIEFIHPITSAKVKITTPCPF